MRLRVSSGMDLRQAMAVARELGVSVTLVNANGEVEFWHPTFTRPIRVHAGRKDAARAVTTALRRLERERRAG